MYGAKQTTRTRDIIMSKMERALMIWFEDCITKKNLLSKDILKAKSLKNFDQFKKIIQILKLILLRQAKDGFTDSKKDFHCIILNFRVIKPQQMLRLLRDLR
jgi:hypothetical protein